MEAFPRRPADARCGECIEKHEAKRQKKLATIKARQQVQALLDKIHQERSGLVSATQLATGLVNKFGGLGPFLDVWYENLSELLRIHKGSERAVRACESVAKLIMQANAMDGARRTPERMSTEELEAEMEAEIHRQVAKIMEQQSGMLGLHGEPGEGDGTEEELEG